PRLDVHEIEDQQRVDQDHDMGVLGAAVSERERCERRQHGPVGRAVEARTPGVGTADLAAVEVDHRRIEFARRERAHRRPNHGRPLRCGGTGRLFFRRDRHCSVHKLQATAFATCNMRYYKTVSIIPSANNPMQGKHKSDNDRDVHTPAPTVNYYTAAEIACPYHAARLFPLCYNRPATPSRVDPPSAVVGPIACLSPRL